MQATEAIINAEDPTQYFNISNGSNAASGTPVGMRTGRFDRCEYTSCSEYNINGAKGREKG